MKEIDIKDIDLTDKEVLTELSNIFFTIGDNKKPINSHHQALIEYYKEAAISLKKAAQHSVQLKDIKDITQV